MQANIIHEGKEIGVIPLNPKTFRTGSTGYHGNDKVEINGERYQVNFLLVKSKAKG